MYLVREQELAVVSTVECMAGCLLPCCSNWGGDAVLWALCHP